MRQNYPKICILIVSMLLPVALTAQNEESIIQGTVAWESPRQVSPAEFLLNFQGAANHDDFGMLPVVSIPLNQDPGTYALSAELSDASFEPLEINDPSKFPDIDLVGPEATVIITNECISGSNRQWVYLLPLRIKKDGNGYEKLISFKIRIVNGPVKGDASRSSGRSFAAHSVLNSGDWYRLGVDKTGIYRITYSDLEAMGINPSAIDPRQIKLYGNGNGMIEEAVSIPRYDDLTENLILVSGEEDGSFDSGDFILFYGMDPIKMSYNAFYQKFEHEVNFYTDKTYYFLTIGPGNGKRVVQQELVTGQPTDTVNSFQDLLFHEKDEVNLIKSGQIWYGEVFNTQLSYDFDFDFPNPDLSQPFFLKANLAGRSTQSTDFNIYTDGELLTSIEVPSVVLGSSIYARALTSNYEQFYAGGSQVRVSITFVKPGTTDMGWLNYLEVNFIRQLVFDGGQLNFRDMRSTGPGNINRYEIQTSQGNLNVWNVTNFESISSFRMESGNGMVSFKDHADTLKEYIAFDGSVYYSPEFVEKIDNQDLHGLAPADFVIITHPLFMEQAIRLADFHRQQDGMSVHIVTPQQIYNEFSSGAQDVSAIRDFMKMLYNRKEEGRRPGYLLLFGDASYDFKGIMPEDDNLVPAYQSRESLKMAASFVTDDYFGCLDEDEGSNGSGTVDIGIGRFPVKTSEQAEEVVDKIFLYASQARENYGPWRNSICFVGDDEDNNIHLNQAEGLTEIADSLGATFNVTKVYLDAYAQLQTPSGTRYPDASKAIDNSVNQGSLLVNYTGHGGEIGWATERVLDIPAIQAYKNEYNMPAFVTATCEFSRYDDPGLVSAGELVFLNPEGAGIGLFTTTRLAYSQSNYSLNKRFYYEAFRIDSLTGDYPRMGDLIRVSKTPSNQNIKNFVLLGDPALMLAYPRMRIRTTSIVNENEDRVTDTIYALSKVTVTGQIEDPEGNIVVNFNGILYSTVYDKPVVYKTRGNDPTSKVTEFTVQDKVLYKGEATVINGEFSFTFIVPKDISFQAGQGKISYYAVDTLSFLDANGHDPVWIVGNDTASMTDNSGPTIDLYLNHFEFNSGDITTAEPMLIARLFDESGINTVGNGIGHDIVMVVDGNYQMSVVLNDQFVPVTDSYQGGEINYRIGPFENGIHTITLKAWDIYNNSSVKTIEFEVNTGARLVITGAHTQPNPLTEQTRFVFDYNKPGVTMDVTLRIFSMMGQQVQFIQYSFNTEALESEPYTWDGRDQSGNELPSGLYVYTITVISEDGFTSEVSQKLMICR